MRIEYIENLSGAPGTLVFFRQEGASADDKMTKLALQLGFEALPDFSGRAGKMRLCSSPAGADILQIGLGQDADICAFREAVSQLVDVASLHEIERLVFHANAFGSLSFDDLVFESLLCLLLTTYRFDVLRAEKKEESVWPETVALVCGKEHEQARLAQDTFESIRLVRDLVNTPANIATPEYMAETARKLTQEYGFSCQVFDPAACEEMKMGCFASVFRGSDTPARFIVLDSNPDAAQRPLVFVGKGVTFDTGGISLKPAANMHEMKSDMAGAATVLGLFKMLGLRSEKRRVVGILPCTENVPGSRATKPGDVVFAMNGKSVEILNTDAEGRLILADALCYSEKYQPEFIVDLATLTGACVVALGEKIAGLFCEDENLRGAIVEHGHQTGEDFWPLPLPGKYKKDLKSDVADLKNMGKREGGAIYATLFLQHFIPEKTPWAHLDIAGPARSKSNSGYWKIGGTGFGLRTLWELVQSWEK